MYVHAYIHMYIRTCMHACIHTYIYIHTYTYIHTYIATYCCIWRTKQKARMHYNAVPMIYQLKTILMYITQCIQYALFPSIT